MWGIPGLLVGALGSAVLAVAVAATTALVTRAIQRSDQRDDNLRRLWTDFFAAYRAWAMAEYEYSLTEKHGLPASHELRSMKIEERNRALRDVFRAKDIVLYARGTEKWHTEVLALFEVEGFGERWSAADSLSERVLADLNRKRKDIRDAELFADPGAARQLGSGKHEDEAANAGGTRE